MNRSFFLCLMLMACESEDGIKVFNDPPEVTITSHSEGATAEDGYTETFRAAVSDGNHDTSELRAQWYQNSEIVCEWLEPDEEGTSSCPMIMTAGLSEILVEVRDPQDAGSSASLEVNVADTEAPSVEIISPVPQQSYYSDALILFEALVSDGEDASEDLLLDWSSSLDGVLTFDGQPSSNGDWSGTHYLTEGEHALTLQVTDSSSKVTSETVVVSVGPANSAPSCSIFSPISQTAGAYGEAISFIGEALDVDESPTSLQVVWVSDKDGEIGTSVPTSSGEVLFSFATLTVNTHTITMEVQDERGEICSDSILLTVGTAPTLVLHEPLDGGVYDEGSPILFSAEVFDSESQPTSIALEWMLDNVLYSNQGPTSSGLISFSDAQLSAGVHTLVLNAEDPDGLTAAAMAIFTVNGLPTQPSVTIAPSSPATGDQLLATASGSTDPEGATVVYTYDWFLNGTPTTYSGPTLPSSATSLGETWSVQAIPTDGVSFGPAGTDSVVIVNSLPTVDSISIAPALSVYNDDTLTCSAVVSDADQTVSPVYTWSSGGQTIGSGSTISLSGMGLMPTDVVVCEASVTDSEGATATDQASVTLLNRDPSIGNMSLSPSTATTSDTIECIAAASDPDGETASLDYAWDVGGSVIGTGSTIVLDSSFVGPGDILTCTVLATDAYGGSDTQSLSLTIQNSPPSLSVDVVQSTAANNETLECVATANDVDDAPQVPQLVYVWENISQNTVLGNAEYLTLDSSMAIDGDVIECIVTATDLNGASVSASDTVDIINTPPQIDSLSFSPDPITSQTSAVQCVVATSDADLHPVTVSYAWMVDGLVQSTTADNLMGPFLIGSTISCTATPNDGSIDGNSATISQTVENSPPTISTISFSPDPVYTDDVLNISVSLLDPDPNQSLSATYDWHVIDAMTGVDSVVQSGNIASLSGQTYFDEDDTIYVDITPYDGLDYGSPFPSTSIVVSNTAPEPPLATLMGIDSNTQAPNSQPLAGDDLQCFVTDLVDADNDSLNVSVTWTVNGVSWTGSTYDTIYTADTIDGGDVFASDVWTCTATVTDDDGEMAMSNTSIINVQSAVVVATCADIMTNMNMWGRTAGGVDLRAWTNSTLHYIGCVGDGCSASSFYCTDNPSSQTLEFGTSGTLRAAVDPGNALGDIMPTSYSGCCNGPLGLCNSFDSNNNNVGLNAAESLCHALGYSSGTILSQVSSNFCPEVHSTTADGLNWSSDFYDSDGYGNKYLCSGYR